MADVVIIGGGPAGSSTAIRLAQQGLSVHLYEKKHFPRPKLCGGFISPEALPELKALGVLERIQKEGAWPVRRVVVASSQGAVAQAELPGPGLSMSRAPLDHLLLLRAREVGANITEGADGFHIQEPAQWTVIAAGRKAPTVQGNRRQSSHQDSDRAARFSARPGQTHFGLQALFEDMSGISDQVELDLASGGYVGLVRQDKERVNLCALATQSAFRHHGPHLDGLLQKWTRQNPVLREHLSRARRVSPWQTTGPVVMGRRALQAGQRLFVGDAACVVDPFVGEGMAMSLKGSRCVSAAFAQTERPIGEAYEAMWEDQLGGSALTIGNFLRATLGNPFFQEVLVTGLQTFPSALRWLTERTRPAVEMKDAY